MSVVALMLCFLPAQAVASLDARRYGWPAHAPLPVWPLRALRILIGVVYFYAGLAKLNSDWLLQAEPLRTWLAAKAHLPLIGPWLTTEFAAYAFSWSGALFDLSIPFLLLFRRTRPLAFVAVVIFHVLTRILFPIGMFPFFMVSGALLFFPAELHRRILKRVQSLFCRYKPHAEVRTSTASMPLHLAPRFASTAVIVILIFQLLLPWRYLAFPGELFWTEQGFRFSWRVMLMEKAGYAQFRVVDPVTQRSFYVDNREFLTPFQEKQMAFQPDFIVEYAHFLADYYRTQGIADPHIYVDCHVALNGRASQRFVRADVNLAHCSTHPYAARDWLLPFKDTIYGL
ncbi:MAG: HTTM domain-containing protein [Bacteroidetes bacterium]|nr:MAG: HTTM domain-containing protein [Bacteroidota bacterium]